MKSLFFLIIVIFCFGATIQAQQESGILDFIDETKNVQEGRVTYKKVEVQKPNEPINRIIVTTKQHIVQKGQILYAIAAQYGVIVEDIVEVNPGLNIHKLYIGQVILIPIKVIQNIPPPPHPVEKNNEVIPSATSAGKLDVNDAQRIEEQMQKGEQPTGIDGTGGVLMERPKNTAPRSNIAPPKNPPHTHIVQPKETMYSISRKYQMTIAEIKEINGLQDNNLSVDQILILKQVEKGEIVSDQTKIDPEQQFTKKFQKNIAAHEQQLSDLDYDKLKPITHNVAKGQTLYAISKLYEQSVVALQKWNQIADNSISEGQSLIVGWYAPKDEEKEIVGNAVASQQDHFKNQYLYFGAQRTGYAKKSKKGLGTWIRNSAEHDYNLFALHTTVPEGTILKITNPMNNRSVFVKVIGSLPSTGNHENVELKITSAAVKRLNIRDKKFLVEYSYYDNK